MPEKSAPARKRIVMIVDDEAIIGMDIALLLEEHGHEALSVTSGEECLKLIRAGRVPDLILMDINLGPDRIDGPETTRRVHEHADIPVILHSAYTDPETIQGTRNMTKYGFIHKVPGNEEFVLATVEMAFKLQERERMYRNLSSHVNRLREEQNAFIAREIHDDLGQSIAALKMNLTMLDRHVREPEARSTISDMREILDTTALKIRSLIHELRPPVLDTEDIVEALQWHAREFEKTFGITLSFEKRASAIRLDPEHSLAVFRVVQEALTNAARHGNPSRVSVTAEQTHGNLVITIADDGTGFMVEQTISARTFGILGMQERAQDWRGTVEITSAPGRGTTVTAVFPVELNAQKEHA